MYVRIRNKKVHIVDRVIQLSFHFDVEMLYLLSSNIVMKGLKRYLNFMIIVVDSVLFDDTLKLK